MEDDSDDQNDNRAASILDIEKDERVKALCYESRRIRMIKVEESKRKYNSPEEVFIFFFAWLIEGIREGKREREWPLYVSLGVFKGGCSYIRGIRSTFFFR